MADVSKTPNNDIEKLLAGKTARRWEPRVRDKFFEPLMNVFENTCRQKMFCSELSDERFLNIGCDRVLTECSSGRDFLQGLHEVDNDPLARATFFDALSSSRRRLFVEECAFELFCNGAAWLENRGRDYLEMLPELRNRPVFAADGHQIEHACHSLKDSKQRHVAPNSLYLLCLHTAMFYNLAPVQGNGEYAHEMPVFRRRLPNFHQRLSKRTRKKTPPIWVVDPAYVDNAFWDRLQKLTNFGGRFVMPLKKGINLAPYEDIPFDPEDEMNAGVVAFQKVVFDDETTMRLVQYQDPETGQEYSFLTTIDDLRPGAIAYLYGLRWRIEKVYDTTNNKLHETKEWGRSSCAQEIHSHFLAMTHNLLTLFKDYLELEHNIEEEKLAAKRKKSLDRRQEKAAAQGRRVHPIDMKHPIIVQLSVQFIRCVRNHILRTKTLLKDCIETFRWRLYKYL